MNTTTGTQSTLRSNIFARSCNDDYSPAMEDLCVKMRLLSLGADPKMEAYDAKLERFFYEEKDEIEIEDNSRDEKNEETFGYNTEAEFDDDAEYGTEACEFNARYGTWFSSEKLNTFKEYQADTGLKTLDAIDYMQSCHNCEKFTIHFGNKYCSKLCCESIEDYRYPCFRGDDCLICYGYPQTTCYWAKNGCDRCDAYDGPEEDRYPYSCTHCLTQMTDHEGYDVDYELYCNNCAADLFDKTGHLEEETRKRPREPEVEELDADEEDTEKEEPYDRMRDLTEESCDIWELALDINNGDKESALDMIDDQERLRAHPRIIEYYRAKEESNDSEECSSECSSEDDNLQQRKRARHIQFESDAEDEADAEDEVVEPMVIDLVSDDEDEDSITIIDLLSQEDSDDYDYAESVVDSDEEYDEEPAQNSVTMSQTVVSSMVAMIQDLRDENAALRDELELLRSQRRMLFPEGGSISFTDDEYGQRYINVHAQAPAGNQSPMTLSELDCDDDESASQDDTFGMDQDE